MSAFVKLKVITQLLVSLVKFIKLREDPEIVVVFGWPPTTTTVKLKSTIKVRTGHIMVRWSGEGQNLKRFWTRA